MKKTLMGLSVLILSGCATVGPSAVKQAHRPYNEALVQSWKEQMLLNIVRLKYRDNPYFLDVTGINTSYVLNANVRSELKVLPKASDANTITPSAGVSYEEKPTITYNPVQGKDFVKQMLSPMSSSSMLKLAEAGWSMERVFSVCVERVNQLQNAPSASGPTPDYVPEYEKFAQWVASLRKLQIAGLIDIGKEPDAGDSERRSKLEELGFSPSDQDSIVLKIRRDPNYATTIDEFYSILGASKSSEMLKFNSNFVKQSESKVTMRTRSLMGMLFYMSQGIEVPEEHINKGLVTVTRYEDGEVFNWNKLSGKVMQIRSQKDKPKDCALRVYYRGYWFFIADNDLASKSTFLLLTKLFNLQAASGGGASPVLTLPVGG